MKLKFVLFLVICFSACLTGFAQVTAEAAQAPAPKPAAVDAPAPAVNPAPVTPAAPALEQKTEEAKPAGDAAPSENRGPLTLDHELPAAIQFLARMANLNIHFDPSISFTNTAGGQAVVPTISLRWENVTAEDALHEVLDNQGLMLVANPRTGISRVTRKPNIVPVVTTIYQLRHTNPTNLVPVISTTFTEGGTRSKVMADQRTAQLVVVATERDHEAITNLLARLDLPTKQVLIEARLLETSKNPKTIKGIDWSGTLEGQKFTFGNGQTTGTTTTTDGDTVTTTLPSGRQITSAAGESSRTTLSTVLGAGKLSLDTARGFFPGTAFLNADGVAAVLSFLNVDNDTEIVATPRAVTSDNETARLEVTRAFPIFQTTPGSANTPAATQVTYTNVGTILNVTPRISANNNIALKVVPEVSNIDSKDAQVINGQRNEANVYAIRRIEANVVIPSGNTLVMGGLISDSSSKSHTKVPVLGDMPVFGLAFRKDSKSRSKSNLIIFVTPTIVRDEDYQPAQTDFLKSKAPEVLEKEWTAWDTGKPVNWWTQNTTRTGKARQAQQAERKP